MTTTPAPQYALQLLADGKTLHAGMTGADVEKAWASVCVGP